MSERKRTLDDGEHFIENNKRNKPSEPLKSEILVKENEGLGSVVAAHYNTIEDNGLSARNKSRIVFMRNFNNWIKSQLIHDYLSKCKANAKDEYNINVLDMCCGKGGDLLKWRNANIRHLLCTDLAKVSLEQCESRYKEMKERNEHSHHRRIFSAEFFDADCTKVRIKDKFQNEDLLLDLVSCQFAFHYSFESLPQAECMIRNAAESLRPGGYFICTIPNAEAIVAKQRENGDSSFGNDVYKINFNCDVNKDFPLFGAQYDFFLEGVVNCPEFLVYFPLLIKLAAKCGLKLVEKKSFQDYYETMKQTGRNLLSRMQALETYPPFEGEKLVGDNDDYSHAKEYIEAHKFCERVGTLSQSEWEAISLYMIAAFVKEEPNL